MNKLKSLLSGINNMLIFIFKVDCNKWRHLFNNEYLYIFGSIKAYTVAIIPYLTLIVQPDINIFGSKVLRISVEFRFLTCFLIIHIYNK